jgi:hypothetical protein
MPTLFKFWKSTFVLLRLFKRCNSRCKNVSSDLHKFAASRRQISSMSKCSYSVTLRHAFKLDAQQVQKVVRHQPWLAGRLKTSMPRVSYADTHCARISVTDKERSVLLRHAHKFCVRQATNSCKSGEPNLHRERPHIKIHSFWRTILKI